MKQKIKKTTVKKKRTVKRKTSMKETTGVLTPKEAKKLMETWFKAPPVSIVNMVYTYYLDSDKYETQRAVTYHLKPGALADIISKYELAESPGELKVYMGCSPTFRHNEISEDAPAFTPFVQLNIPGANLPPFSNSYECVWRKRSTSALNYNVYPRPASVEPEVNVEENPSRLSPYTAHLFLQEWCMTSDAQIEGMFRGIVNGQVQRVNSFTFEEEDLKTIAKLYNEDTSKELFIHLSVIKPNTRSPFGFHIVLELAKAKNNMAYAEDGSSEFFEYSYPCPPLCSK